MLYAREYLSEIFQKKSSNFTFPERNRLIFSRRIFLFNFSKGFDVTIGISKYNKQMVNISKCYTEKKIVYNKRLKVYIYIYIP